MCTPGQSDIGRITALARPGPLAHSARPKRLRPARPSRVFLAERRAAARAVQFAFRAFTQGKGCGNAKIESGRKLLAAAGAASAKHLAATNGRRAGAEAVTAGADKAAGLESALHVSPRIMQAAHRGPNKKAARKQTTTKQMGAVTGDGRESQDERGDSLPLTPCLTPCYPPMHAGRYPVE